MPTITTFDQAATKLDDGVSRKGDANTFGERGMDQGRRIVSCCALALGIALAASGGARADQLLTNGGFDAGLSGWSVANNQSTADYAGGNDGVGSFYAQGSSKSPPVSGRLTGGSVLLPDSGLGYALSDSTGPGAHALIQSFTVPINTATIQMSWNMYTYDWYGAGATGSGFDYTDAPNQHVEVDILSAGAGAFATGSGSVVATLFTGEIANPSGSNPPSWETFSANLTGLLTPGGTYQVRFAEVDNQFTLNMGVDNVSINAIPAAVPAPAAWVLMSLGLTPMALVRFLRRRSARR